ncbi:MAG: chromosome segregation protein SMC [Planctomycetales bacterium]|nr:chromosome segregation protein SMC [Planctomycetales bacterium]
MLTALELAGFKSFADRTRFDFPDGITVIVGPNGSGKSNVVDAIKWVLGAQSAKSLRGKDMIDVIFKGSSSSGRKPANTAEATLVFDNSGKHFPIDAEEVQVTRRVYRSGESEYQINGNSCRLKDIKDLFRGTGVGVDAYSLIEQGKVDRMLQASPKDRRLIFEEAAGISRFNAKKAEAARRLQRVDQNLVRLKDIVDEVHTRLSTLKSQATKANKFRELTARLNEVRVLLGWNEFRRLREERIAAEQKTERLLGEIVRAEEELNTSQVAAQQAELALHAVAEQCQDVESTLQESQQRVAVGQNERAALQSRVKESLDEQARQANRLLALRARAGSFQEHVAEIQARFEQSELSFTQTKQRADQASQQADGLRQTLADVNLRQQKLRNELVVHLRQASDKSASVAHQENTLSELMQSISKTKRQIEENQQAESSARKAVELTAARLKEVHLLSGQANADLSQARVELRDNETRLASLQEQAGVLQGILQGASERLAILEQLQQHLEGVDAGARYVLDLAAKSDSPALRSVRGLVAEQLEVDVNLAPLIDTALGHTAHALILEDGQLYQTVRAGQLEVPGRLSLIRMDRLPVRRYGEKVQLEGVQGVIGRADRMVTCHADVAPLFRYLLGTTWLVEDLDVAFELGHFRGAGLRFVTAACELIDADGTLTIGGIQSSSGLVSRRSEIQNAKEEIVDCKTRYQRSQGEIERANSRIEKLTPRVAELEVAAKNLAQEFAHQQAGAQNAVGKLDELETKAEALQQKLQESEAKYAEIEPTITGLIEEVRSIRAAAATIESELKEHDHSAEAINADLKRAIEAETNSRIEQARAEQRLESAQSVLEQSNRNQQERLQAVNEATQELRRLQSKQEAVELKILCLTSGLADDYLVSESAEGKLDELAKEAAILRRNRSVAVKNLESATRALDKLRSAREASNNELQRSLEASSALLKRYRDDHEIDLESLSLEEEINDPKILAELDNEAAKLRQDIASVGEINMAALAELDELQGRFDYLNNQYDDLQAAKDSLQRIIQKINTDSRKMFLETLEIIRTNFQKLYRKSFGGGSADIVLEAGEDVLECGIDIIATPPGKTALSNSLLSGGEKALTAVALLLAIFQYRPSPFCVLDEVDAPFDEANIGRFVNVLTEFLDWTKFIIVTHSKKTMTASTTLYGVTMQESGVSKQVAVRFEDVNEKGEVISANESKRRAA